MHESKKQVIIDVLKENVSPFLIYLFGSTTKGTTHKKSDIDIAFLSYKKELDSYEVFLLSQELASRLDQEVDLIDLRKASTVFQAQVVYSGKAIYCTDEPKKERFELLTLKMYAKLNEERSSILKNIDESGSIYEK